MKSKWVKWSVSGMVQDHLRNTHDKLIILDLHIAALDTMGPLHIVEVRLCYTT